MGVPVSTADIGLLFPNLAFILPTQHHGCHGDVAVGGPKGLGLDQVPGGDYE